MKILVTGNHPILKSESSANFDDPLLAKEYHDTLFEAGYDNLEMKPLLSEAETEELAKKVLPDVMMFGDDFAYCPECNLITSVFTDWRDAGSLKCEECNFVLEV